MRIIFYTIKKIESKEHRDAFVDSSIDVGLMFQLPELRRQRGLTQKRLAKMAGVAVKTISRIECGQGGTTGTLKKIAHALDIGVVVRFAPISELFEFKFNINSELLKVASYKDDPYFEVCNEKR